MSGVQPVLVSGPAISIAASRHFRAGFCDRLGRHFERKIALMSMPSAAIQQ
jgi:hypothetical protein